MASIKPYSDLEQSRKLAEILPLESADMYWSFGNIKFMDDDYDPNVVQYIPCWSLASLLEQFPYELCDDYGNSLYLEINKEEDVYQLAYTDPYGDFESIETDRYEHFVDACCELILKLNELNLL